MKDPQYIILTYPRTGSTFLCGTLARHPDISADGMEMFNENHLLPDHHNEKWRIKKFKELYGKSQEEMQAIGPFKQPVLDSYKYDFVPFIRDFVEEFHSLKLCYHQMRVDSPVWDFYLNEAPSTKVIYMNRDFLEACVSFYTACETNVWHLYHRFAKKRFEPISVSPGYMCGFYHRFCSFEEAYRKRLSDLESMEVHYEEIQSNPDGVLLEVQEFLGLEPMPLEWLTYKQSVRSIRERLSNYDELMSSLGGLSPLEYAKRNPI